jgi:putative oxidoreductase
MKNLIPTILRVLLALPFIVFGLNKFLMFANMPPPADPTAQAFLGAMFTSYLVKIVGATEIIAGILLLMPRTAFLGALVLLPVSVNIAAFHLFHDMPGNGIWIVTTLLHAAVLYSFKDKFSVLSTSIA